MNEPYIYLHGAPARAAVQALPTWFGDYPRICTRGLAVMPAYRSMRRAGVPADRARSIVWDLCVAARDSEGRRIQTMVDA